MKLLVEIDMDSDAFAHEPQRELACALLHITESLLVRPVTFPSPNDNAIRDTDGQYIGFWRVSRPLQ